MTKELEKLIDNRNIPAAAKLERLAKEIEGLEAVVAAAGTLIDQCLTKVTIAMRIMTEEQKQRFFAEIEA